MGAQRLRESGRLAHFRRLHADARLQRDGSRQARGAAPRRGVMVAIIVPWLRVLGTDGGVPGHPAGPLRSAREHRHQPQGVRSQRVSSGCSRVVRALPLRVLAGHRRAPRLPGGVRPRPDRCRMARRPHPRAVRRWRPRGDRGLRHPRGDQPLRRQCRRLPRADVHHGRARAARISGPEAGVPAAHRERASCGCSRSPSRSRRPGPTRPARAPRPSAAAIATSSTGRRSGSRGSSTRT